MKSHIFDRDSVKLFPVFAIMYLFLKAYVVADYSLTTAGALVVAAPFTVLVGTVSSYLTLAMLLTAVGATFWLYQHRTAALDSERDTDSKTIEAMVFGLLIVSIMFLPWPFSVEYFQEALLSALLYSSIAGIFILAVGYLASKVQAGKRTRWLLARGHLFALFVVILLLPTLDRPWVPAEVLVLRSSIAIQDSHLNGGDLQTSKYPVVFVLSEGGKWTTVLDVDTRILLRLPTDSVAHRQICRYRDQPPGSVPIWAFVSGFRYDSPNTMCYRLVNEHETRLDPLVVPEMKDPDPGR